MISFITLLVASIFAEISSSDMNKETIRTIYFLPGAKQVLVS
jgi:hypothetical protein